MLCVASHRLTATLGAVCILGLLTTTLAPPAPATTTYAHPPQVAAEHHESAPQQTGPALDPPAALALSCPGGWFCFFDETNFGGDRGKLSDCGWQNLATYQWQNRIEAAYYNLPSGSAAFYESNGTYLFQVSAANRSLSDVGSKQNKADKVYRTCPTPP